MPDATTPASHWSTTTSLINALNPVLLLVLGAWLNHGIDEAKASAELARQQSQQAREQLDQLSVRTKLQVDKVKVVQDFMDALTGTDSTRRRVAIEAIFIVLPDEAPRLVKAIEQRDDKAIAPAEASTVRSALDAARTAGVRAMFSESRTERIGALDDLQRRWSGDATVAWLLMQQAQPVIGERAAAGWREPATDTEQWQRAVLYNVTKYLAQTPASDGALRDGIRKFCEQVRGNSADTARLADAVIKRPA